MDDILFGNNNQATINRLAKRSYRANKQRNVFVTIALFLTAFMITSVFSLGCSYFETYQMQQIRAMGTTADVAITSLSEEQYEELSRSSLVSVVGVSQRLGSIDTSGMDDALLSITWIDETEWQEHRVPTISDIHGDYPQAKNEIMLSTWALRAMGIDDPQIGMNNIFRNPKSAFLTFASLFLGLILFLVSAGLLSSLSPNNFVNQWGESDFALTYSISEEGNLLSDEMLQQIETMQGIENLRVTYSASPWPTMDVIYDENVFGKYIDSLDGVSGLDFSNAETRKNYTDNFWSGVYGIDSRYIEELNKTLDKPIDLTAFEKGELVVLSAMTDDEGKLLIQPGQAITVVGESGEQVFTVATGFLDADFQSGRGNERGTAPDLYISEQAIEKLSGETKIFRIAFDTIDSSYDKGIMEQLQSITASSPGITILSRYEKQQEMAGYLLTSRIIAAGLSAVFLLIGIMNFINTMVVSVNTRKHEFATLESIGMTKKQIRNVLLWEGGYYWSISFLLLATLGTAIYIPIYSVFRKMVPYAAFSYPVIPLLSVAAIVLLVCFVTPVITFKQGVKESVVERLRQN